MFTIRSAPTASGSSTSSVSGSGARALIECVLCPVALSRRLGDTAGHRRRHRGEAGGPDLTRRVASLHEERPQVGTPTHRGCVPVFLVSASAREVVAPVEADRDLGVADVQDEEHGRQAIPRYRRSPRLAGGRASVLHKESFGGSAFPNHPRHGRRSCPAGEPVPLVAMPRVLRSTAPCRAGTFRAVAPPACASAAASRSGRRLRQRMPEGSEHRTAAGSSR